VKKNKRFFVEEVTSQDQKCRMMVSAIEIQPGATIAPTSGSIAVSQRQLGAAGQLKDLPKGPAKSCEGPGPAFPQILRKD
jgi:hypothetical protein